MTNPNPLKEYVERALANLESAELREAVEEFARDLLIAVRESLPEESTEGGEMGCGDDGFNSCRAEMEKTLSEYIEGSLT